MAKGQTLVIGAVLFAGILIIASFPSGPDISGTNSNNRQFAENALEKSVETFNRDIRQNHSSLHMMRSIYNYGRFVERLSSAKGQKFSMYSLYVLPGKEKAGFVNYKGKKANLTLDLGDEQFNRTINDSQYELFSYTMDNDATQVNLTMKNRDREYEFIAGSPRLLTWMRFESNDETWVNYVIG